MRRLDECPSRFFVSFRRRNAVCKFVARSHNLSHRHPQQTWAQNSKERFKHNCARDQFKLAEASALLSREEKKPSISRHCNGRNKGEIEDGNSSESEKRTRLTPNHLDRTSLINKLFIIWQIASRMTSLFSCAEEESQL